MLGVIMKDKFYINSLPYEIELTARICHENAKKFLESITDELSIDEFAVLDTIIAKPNLSQADLARIILKGKAHTGRFLMSLEDKGFVERHVEERGGKLIKVSVVTLEGLDLYNKIIDKMAPSIKSIQDVISEDEVQNIIENLRNFRISIEKVSKIVFE